ncbi:type VI secretion system contractile sheath large subunit, partial [Salmonella enterica subsp. enterica serovar Infantis]
EKNGFISLIHIKKSYYDSFIGAQSLQKPQEFYDPEETANANLSARLPYLFACSRFPHFLNSIVRDKIGTVQEREQMQRWLNE